MPCILQRQSHDARLRQHAAALITPCSLPNVPVAEAHVAHTAEERCAKALLCLDSNGAAGRSWRVRT
jgi:hypothetical protein